MSTQAFTIFGTSFVAEDNASARTALEFTPDAPLYPTIEHHVPGAGGNILSWMGYAGNPIQLRCRYRGADAAALAVIVTTDMSLFSGTTGTVVANGVTYARCKLESAKWSTPISSTGIGTNCYCIVDYVFKAHS